MAIQQNSRPDVYQIVTDRIVEMLENGTAPWRKPWSSSDNSAPKNLVSGKYYNGINYFLLGCQQYDSPYWLTYKQAQERGGHVRKGEKGSPCIFWKMWEKASAATDDNSDSGELATDSKKIPVIRYYTVFNADQCDGIEAPKPEVKEWPEHERIEKAEAIQLAMPKRPVVEYGGNSAYYNPSQDLVRIPELKRFEKPQEYYSALFHELAHSTGHKDRLIREGINRFHGFGSKEYSREELVAEMASAFICAHCGIENETLENSAAYLNGWIKAMRGDKKLAVVAAAQAQKAANWILNIKQENVAE